jgi:hypothetical protein
VATQSPVPGDRVLVVGVDQGAVDVEDDRDRLFPARRDGFPLPAIEPRSNGGHADERSLASERPFQKVGLRLLAHDLMLELVLERL